MAFYFLNPQFFYKSAIEPYANFYQYNITGRIIDGIGGPLAQDAVAAPPAADYCDFNPDGQTMALLVTGLGINSEVYLGNDWVYDGDTGTALNLGVDVLSLNATNPSQPVIDNFLQADLSAYDGMKIALRYDPDRGFPNSPESIIVNLAINTDIICNNTYYQSHDYTLNAGDRVIVTLDFNDCEKATPTGVCNQMCGLPTGSFVATNLDKVGNIGIRIKENPLAPYLYEAFATFSLQATQSINAIPQGSATGAGVTTLTIPSVTLNATDTIVVGVLAVADTIVSVEWNTNDATLDVGTSFNASADNAGIYSYRSPSTGIGNVVVTTTGSVSNFVLMTVTRVVGLVGNDVYWKGQQPTLVDGNNSASDKNESWSSINDEPDSGFTVPTLTTSLFAAGLVITNYFNGTSQPSVSFGSWSNGFVLDQQTTINDAPTNAYGLSQGHYITDNYGHFKAAKIGNYTADSDYWGALTYLYA